MAVFVSAGRTSSPLNFTLAATLPAAEVIPSSALTQFVPHFVTGDNFVTKMTIANLSANQNPVTVNFLSQSGNLLETQQLTLAPGSSYRLETPEADRTAAPTTRWAVVGSQFPVGINLFFELKDPSSNQMVTTVGFNDVPPVGEFTIPVELEPARPGDPAPRTVGLAIANTANASNTVTLRLHKQDGTLLATQALTLEPFAQTAFNVESLPSLKAALPTGNFLGVVAVTATRPVAAIGVGDDFGPFFSIPIITGRSRTIFIPHIVTGQGFVTKITLVNVSDSTNSVTVDFLDQSGSLLETQNLTLAPRASQRFATTEAERFTSPTTRWATVEAEEPAGVNLFFELVQPDSPRIVTAVGFNDVSSISRFVLPVELEPARPGDPAPRTVGLALANPTTASNTVTLRLVDRSGTVLATETMTLGPFAQTAFNVENLSSFRPAIPLGNFLGVVTVSGTGPLSAIGVGDDFGPFFSIPIIPERQDLEIHYINVGWGTSVLVIGPDGTTVLLEAGSTREGTDEVVPYLKSIGIQPVHGLDFTIVGHQHCDHLGGLDEVVNAGYDVRRKNYYNGSSYTSSCVTGWNAVAASTTAGDPIAMLPGKQIFLGNGAKLTVLAVNGNIIGGGFVSVSDENDRSIALLIQHRDFDFLWASDLGGGNIDQACTGRFTSTQTDVETHVIQAILPDGARPMISPGGIDVLHANHHGSESSTNKNWMNLSAPAVAVIAVGAGQSAGWDLPRKDVVENVLLANATACIAAPAALVLQTEEGSPIGSQTSFAGYSVGNIKITTNGLRTFAVSADGQVNQGSNEVAAAGLPRIFPLDD